jgi:hypothetical protein
MFKGFAHLDATTGRLAAAESSSGGLVNRITVGTASSNGDVVILQDLNWYFESR